MPCDQFGGFTEVKWRSTLDMGPLEFLFTPKAQVRIWASGLHIRLSQTAQFANFQHTI